MFYEALWNENTTKLVHFDNDIRLWSDHDDDDDNDDDNKKLSYRRETARQLRNVYIGWLTDRAMHRTPQNRRGCTISDIQTLW